MARKPLSTRQDINDLLQAFYARAMADPVIGYIFTDVARMDLAAHLPVIGNFWEKVLLHRPVYFGNPLAVHRVLHAASPLRAEHFERWLALWSDCVDQRVEGPLAVEAKRRAAIIAAAMQHHLGIDAGPEPFPTDAPAEA